MEPKKTIKEIIKLAKDEGLCELKYEDKNIKVEFKFPTASMAGIQFQPQQQMYPVNNSTPMATTTNEAPVSTATPKAAPEGHEILSPFVGTYYASSSPGKDPFVTIGSKVKKGQTLCILEAMKIMNEIESDADGEIIEICAENESVVEYGQPLFRIKKG